MWRKLLAAWIATSECFSSIWIDKRKLIITLCTIVAIVAVGLGIFKMLQLVKEVEQVKDYNTESLRWAIIGAIGSWTGSVFGAIALVVSLVALWLPQRVKIAVGVSTGFILSQIPGIEKIDAYIITVKNTGMKPVTVTNVYLHPQLLNAIHSAEKIVYLCGAGASRREVFIVGTIC